MSPRRAPAAKAPPQEAPPQKAAARHHAELGADMDEGTLLEWLIEFLAGR